MNSPEHRLNYHPKVPVQLQTKPRKESAIQIWPYRIAQRGTLGPVVSMIHTCTPSSTNEIRISRNCQFRLNNLLASDALYINLSVTPSLPNSKLISLVFPHKPGGRSSRRDRNATSSISLSINEFVKQRDHGELQVSSFSSLN
jgi:hypothetical protein